MSENTIIEKNETRSIDNDRGNYHKPLKLITKQKLLGYSILIAIIVVVPFLTQDNLMDIVRNYLKKATTAKPSAKNINSLTDENKQIYNKTSNSKEAEVEIDTEIAIGSISEPKQNSALHKKNIVDTTKSDSLIEQSIGLNQHDLEEKIIQHLSEVTEPDPHLIVPQIGNGSEDDTNARRLQKLRDDAAALAERKRIERFEKAEQAKALRLAKISGGNTAKLDEVFNECEDATILHAIQLQKNVKSIRNSNVPAYWKAVNNTDQNVAITLRQDNKNLAVVFIPSKSEYKSRIPATFFKFAVKGTNQKCIKWMENSGVVTSLPLREDIVGKVKKESGRFYRNAIFETEIDSNKGAISAQTKLVGYALKDK